MRFYTSWAIKNIDLFSWNPYILGGQAVTADIQNAVFYPFNLIILPLTGHSIDFDYWLLEMQAIFHLFWGALFMYILMLYLRVRRLGALLSALVFTFSAFLVVHLKHVNMIYSAIWLPLIFLFYYLFLNRRKIIYLLLTGSFLGISLLGGHPQIVYYIFLVLFLYLIYFLVANHYFKRKQYKEILIFLLSLVGVFVISIALAAVELFPFWELFRASSRADASYLFATRASLHPLHFLVTSFLPHLFGGETDLTPYYGPWNYWETANYIGVSTLLIIFLGIFSLYKRNRLVRFFTFLALFSILLAFGGNFFFYIIAYYFFPGFNLFRVPARLIFLYNFSLAVLVGFVVDFLSSREGIFTLRTKLEQFGKGKFSLLYYSLISIIFSLMVSPLFFLIKLKLPVLIDFFILFYLSAVTMILLIFWLKQKIGLKIFSILLLFIIVTDLFIFGYQFNNGHLNPGQYYKKNEIINFLKKEDSYYRVWSKIFLPVNIGNIYRIPSVEGWAAFVSKRYRDFTQGDFARHIFALAKFNDSLNRLNLLNVKYILSERSSLDVFEKIKQVKEVTIYKNPYVLPKAFLVPKVSVIKDPVEILKKIDGNDFDPREEIVLEEPVNLSSSHQEKVLANSEVQILNYSPNKIVLEANTPRPAMLFLGEVYDPGWQVYIDGIKNKIHRANFLFRAVWLDPGEHQIEFIYNPLSFKIGLMVSVSTSVVILFIFLFYLGLWLNLIKKKKLKKTL